MIRLAEGEELASNILQKPQNFQTDSQLTSETIFGSFPRRTTFIFPGAPPQVGSPLAPPVGLVSLAGFLGRQRTTTVYPHVNVAPREVSAANT